MLLTVQLVGPSWGPTTGYTSATLLRRQDAAKRVQAEFDRVGSCSQCAPVDVRLALQARGVEARRSAEHAELVGLVERSMPVAGTDNAELDSIQCSATSDWVPADVRVVVAAQCAVAPARLRGLYVHDAPAPESATMGELGVADGAMLQLVVGSVSDATPQPRRAESAKAAVVRQRARDAKKQHVTTVRGLLATGERHQRHHEWRPAADCYSQAVIAMSEGNPELQNLLSNRGLCRARMGEYRNAWMDHNRALVLAPSMHSRTLHYLNRGNCALRLGMLEEARDDFEMAALHASTSSVSSGAAKQLQRLQRPLRAACEGQFAWLRQYYPAVLLSRHCASVEAFQAVCKETREILGRQMSTLSRRHDRCALVHKRTLETICKENDMDPGQIAEGARAEFERILKQETKALLLAHAEKEEQEEQEEPQPSGSERSIEYCSAPEQVETLHESELREARENQDKWLATQASMEGNVTNGFVLLRERQAVYAIAHRGCDSSATAAAVDIGGVSAKDSSRRSSAGLRTQQSAQPQQRRPATAPASNTRARPGSADTTGLHSTVSVRSSIGSMDRRMLSRETSLEVAFRRLLPTTVDSGNNSDAETELHDASGSAEDRKRPGTALSQKEKLLAQQRSGARLSNLSRPKAKGAAKPTVNTPLNNKSVCPSTVIAYSQLVGAGCNRRHGDRNG